MPHVRFFVDQALSVRESLPLSGNESHHLLKAIRGNVGDSVELINGRGVLAIAEITKVCKKEAWVIVQTIKTEMPPSRTVILAWGMPNLSHLEWGVEKAVELGVSEIWLFTADKSVKIGLSPLQKERLSSITIAAMKQSGRLFMPKIELKSPINEWSLDKPSYFGSLLPNTSPLNSYPIQQNDVLLIIGPESGFSKNEEDTLIQLGAKPVSFNPNVLRTETAVLAGLSIILQHNPLENR